MSRRIIPDVVDGQTIQALAPDASAREAAQAMVANDISAVLINDAAGRLIGIVTERDLARRVVAAGLDGAATRLEEVMTASPECIAPDETPERALRLMQVRRYRHLPVAVEGRAVGIVSLRDLRTAGKRGGVVSWFAGQRRAG